MVQELVKPRLIHSRRGAAFALCLTGYAAALTFRNLLLHSQHKLLLLIDSHFSLPTWVAAAINLGFYAYLIWVSAALYRLAQGKERVLVGGWAASFFIGLIKYLVSTPAAAVIYYLQALGMLLALLAAVEILCRMPASGYPRLDTQTSRNT